MFRNKPSDLYRLLALDGLAALAIFSLPACSTTPVVAVSGATCPSLPEYSRDVQKEAAAEIAALPPGAIIGNIFIPDYGRMRAGVRECLKAQGGKQ